MDLNLKLNEFGRNGLKGSELWSKVWFYGEILTPIWPTTHLTWAQILMRSIRVSSARSWLSDLPHWLTQPWLTQLLTDRHRSIAIGHRTPRQKNMSLFPITLLNYFHEFAPKNINRAGKIRTRISLISRNWIISFHRGMKLNNVLVQPAFSKHWNLAIPFCKAHQGN